MMSHILKELQEMEQRVQKVSGVSMVPTDSSQIKIIEDIMSGKIRLLAVDHTELKKAWSSDGTWDALSDAVYEEKGLETKLKKILAADLLALVEQYEDLKHSNSPHFSDANKERLLKAIEPFLSDRSKVKKMLGGRTAASHGKN